MGFCWIVRFPMFKPAKEDVDKLDSKSSWTFMHNPFSAPVDEHVPWLLAGQNVDQIVARQYDLVCNGMEIGSGSIRAHTRPLLEATYKVMGYSQAEIEASVGHMLEAFDYGTPPHGGVALGIDRLVMLACKEESMKEVIAFPTTTSGRTAVMAAPIADRQGSPKRVGSTVIHTRLGFCRFRFIGLAGVLIPSKAHNMYARRFNSFASTEAAQHFAM